MALPNPHRIKLTAEQQDLLDHRVLNLISGGAGRQQAIASRFRELGYFKDLPKRTEAYRYIEQSIRRLQKAGRIALFERAVGWKMVSGNGST